MSHSNVHPVNSGSGAASAAPRNAPLVAAEHASDKKAHLLFCASGSVATIKTPNIIQALSKHPSLSIRIILSESAKKFLAGQSLEQPSWQSLLDIPNVDAIYFDEDEWIHPWTRGAPILHIELRKWLDLCVIAPLSANTLAKIVNGFSDNLLTSVIRAWDTTGMIDGVRRSQDDRHMRKQIVAAPAMNTAMWLHPITEEHMKVLENDWGIRSNTLENGQVQDSGWIDVLRPKEGELACGDVGIGAMADWQEIVKAIETKLGLNSL